MQALSKKRFLFETHLTFERCMQVCDDSKVREMQSNYAGAILTPICHTAYRIL